MDSKPHPVILGVVALACATSVSAQQPFPTASDQAQWSVVSYILGQPFDTIMLASTGSIDLCDRTYSVVMDAGFGVEMVFFRNEGQRTLFRLSEDCGEREYLLYDMAMNVGDSTYVGWQMGQPSLDTTLVIVEAIDVVEYLGIPRRRSTVRIDRCPGTSEPPLFTQDQWIEGIGSVGHPFYSVNCLCDFCESGFTLQCADSANVPTYRFPAGTSCGPITGVPEERSGPGVLQVAGGDGYWSVHLPEGISAGIITVHDLNGAEVLRSRASGPVAVIDARRLAPGSYVVSLRTTGGNWWARTVATP